MMLLTIFYNFCTLWLFYEIFIKDVDNCNTASYDGLKQRSSRMSEAIKVIVLVLVFACLMAFFEYYFCPIF